MPLLFIDFETYSECDLKQAGAVRYAQDATTRALCMAYAVDDEPAKLWIPPGTDMDLDVASAPVELTRRDVHFVAHNIGFERAILKHVLGIDTPLERWSDTMAIARHQSLPGSLQNLCEFFGATKDKKGNAAMMRLCKPRKPTKFNRDTRVTREKDPEKYEEMYHYCQIDVELMRKCHRVMRPMNDFERRVWLMTDRMNERGMLIDAPAMRAAKDLLDVEATRIVAEAVEITGGITPTQTKALTEWLGLPNLKAETVQKAEQAETDPDRLTVLQARAATSKASVKKLDRMDSMLSHGNLVHHALAYCGAESTGRWSGRAVQIQNFPRGKGGAWLDAVFQKLASGEKIENPFATISNALKGFIIAPAGRTLVMGDFSQIEARCVAWLAGQDDLLQVFADGGDPYCVMAEKIFRYPVNKTDNPDERQLGKAVILGCGFQMGAPKFRETVAKAPYFLDLSMERAEDAVSTYRESYPKIVKFWYDCDKAYKAVANRKGSKSRVGRCVFHGGKSVKIELPSGNFLFFNRAGVSTDPELDKFGRGTCTFYGQNPYTRKYGIQTTYGGSLVQSVVQRTARDIIAESMLRVEADPTFNLVTSVHDEAVADAPSGSLNKFIALMSEPPKWAPGFPLEIEAKEARRYQK